jgi:hypothetical protein
MLDQVFVAMSFETRFDHRFSAVIQPAIEAEPIAGLKLKAHRVDISKTGESILTEIVAGIAHSRLVLADVSVVDEGRYTQIAVRNANVMYEVGLALACRSPSEVLLVRDDDKPLLFDLSTIPTMLIDFQDVDAATLRLRAALADRLRESTLLTDARVRQAARSLTQYELQVLRSLASVGRGSAVDLSMPGSGSPSIPTERGLSGLLGRGFAQAVGINATSGGIWYSLTPLGRILAQAVEQTLRKIAPAPSVSAADSSDPASI